MCAVRALTATGYPTAARMCQMWARISYEHAIGREWEFAHLPSARQACLAFKNTIYVVKGRQKPEPGDVLYKQGLPGSSGHVGIYVGSGMVAENSSIHDTTGDARGLRTLSEFGGYTLSVRYPAP
jgi:cell wall-associated NlpC family hydrolase